MENTPIKIKVNNTHLLYAFGLGLLVSDIIPTPADALYFRMQQVNKEKLEKNEITPKQYWIRDAVHYYGFNALWWGLVLTASYYSGKDFTQKRNILLGLIAAGAVVGVIGKNIKLDEALYGTYKSTPVIKNK